MPSNDIPRADVIIYSLRIATLKGGVYAAFIDLPINKHYNSINSIFDTSIFDAISTE